MTLPRLLIAMALRSLATRIEQRIDPIVSTLVGAVGYATEGRWDVDVLLAVPSVVGEVGARVSGVVAGCGCDASNWMDCKVSGDVYCVCRCHDAIEKLVMAESWVGDARETLVARPKPEAPLYADAPWGSVGWHGDPPGYGVTAPGGAS